MAKFPHMSPYVAFDNNPIYYTDPYGLESVNDTGNEHGGSGEEGEGGEGDPPAGGGILLMEVEVKAQHQIKKGDSFWALERRYGLEHGSLQEWNPHLNPRNLPIGTTIILYDWRAEHPSGNPLELYQEDEYRKEVTTSYVNGSNYTAAALPIGFGVAMVDSPANPTFFSPKTVRYTGMACENQW